MTEKAKQATGWWGDWSVDEGATGYWGVGGYEMWTRRTPREWQIHSRRGDDPGADARVVEIPTDRPIAEDCQLRRFAFRSTAPEIRVLPALADRSMVIRPDVTFFIPAKEESTLYISTPLWLIVYLGTTSPVMDIASYRPSDTWFGPDTRSGEMCYSSRTRASHDLADVTRLPHRAISVVKIRNRAASRLEFERIMIPVMNLSLYADPAGFLWTETVSLEHEEDGDFADMRLGRGAPEEADGDGKAVLVNGPRQKQEKGLSLRAFGSLLG